MYFRFLRVQIGLPKCFILPTQAGSLGPSYEATTYNHWIGLINALSQRLLITLLLFYTLKVRCAETCLLPSLLTYLAAVGLSFQ